MVHRTRCIKYCWYFRYDIRFPYRKEKLERCQKLCGVSLQKTIKEKIVKRKSPSNRAFSNERGGGEIRTHGPRKESLVFKTSAFNHSATPPLTTLLYFYFFLKF
jgi:hypothetical protein